MDIVQIYQKYGTIKGVADELGISQQKARKVLITHGLFENDTSAKIKKLHDAGKTIPEISELLRMGKSAVASYLPYSKGEYNALEPTINALRIRRCRRKGEDNDKESIDR